MNSMILLEVNPTTPAMLLLLDSLAQQQRLTIQRRDNQQWQVSCSLESAYAMLEQLVQKASSIRNEQIKNTQALHYSPQRQLPLQNSTFIAPQSQTPEQKLLLATADAFVLALYERLI